MSAKKSNTPRKSATNQQPTIGRKALRQELARDLASICANPETPVRLFDAIKDEICDWVNVRQDEWLTAEQIAESLDAYARREEKRTKGGAR